MNKLEDVKIEDLGRVSEVTITKDDCLLMKVCATFQLDSFADNFYTGA